MSSLTPRKQLLIAESEINRAQLFQEWETITGNVRHLGFPLRSFGKFASVAALVMAGFAAFPRRNSLAATAKPSKWEAVFKGVRLACSICLFIRARAQTKASE